MKDSAEKRSKDSKLLDDKESTTTDLEADLDKEMTENETQEKDAQAAHATIMKDSAEQRTKDSKLIDEKKSQQKRIWNLP